MRYWLAAILGLALAGSAWSGNLKTLIAAERAFASDAPVRGVKLAFLDVLAADSLLFRPGPVNGREWFASRPDEAPYVLEWAPAAAEASGGLGYTFGPYKLTPNDGSDAGGGHFFSVWLEDARGHWRLLLDSGIQHELITFPENVKARGTVGPKATSRQVDLEGFDDALNVLRGRAHAAEALFNYFADDAVVLRSGSMPQRRSQLAESSAMRGIALRKTLRISSDGRLAATAGATLDATPHAYQRAWRYVDGEGWKVVVDLVGD